MPGVGMNFIVFIALTANFQTLTTGYDIIAL